MLRRYFVAALTLASACSADLLGPAPNALPHFTALVDGRPFVGFLGADACIGTQASPGMFFLNVHAGIESSSPEIALHLGGIGGPGRFRMRPQAVQTEQRAALYIPDDPARLQYSALTRTGDILIDEYDPEQRTVAGRFYFRAIRALGSDGPEWVSVRQGSFRGRLRVWGSAECSEPQSREILQ